MIWQTESPTSYFVFWFLHRTIASWLTQMTKYVPNTLIFSEFIYKSKRPLFLQHYWFPFKQSKPKWFGVKYDPIWVKSIAGEMYYFLAHAINSSDSVAASSTINIMNISLASISRSIYNVWLLRSLWRKPEIFLINVSDIFDNSCSGLHVQSFGESIILYHFNSLWCK